MTWLIGIGWFRILWVIFVAKYPRAWYNTLNNWNMRILKTIILNFLLFFRIYYLLRWLSLIFVIEKSYCALIDAFFRLFENTLSRTPRWLCKLKTTSRSPKLVVCSSTTHKHRQHILPSRTFLFVTSRRFNAILTSAITNAIISRCMAGFKLFEMAILKIEVVEKMLPWLVMRMKIYV